MSTAEVTARPKAKHPKDMTPEEREAFHQKAESEIVIFAHKKPDLKALGRPKKTNILVNRPYATFLIQTVGEGGENNLHYHTVSETTWMVLKGGARFLGPGGKVWAELGPGEGIHLPGGVRYSFHKIGDEDLEILQAVVQLEPGTSERLNIDAHKEWMVESHLTKY